MVNKIILDKYQAEFIEAIYKSFKNENFDLKKMENFSKISKILRRVDIDMIKEWISFSTTFYAKEYNVMVLYST